MCYFQIIFKGKTYISTLMMVSIIDFIYTLDKILTELTHCSPELIKEKLNGVSHLVINWIYFTHMYKAYSYRTMIMENASLEIIPLYIFFSGKGFVKSWYDKFGLFFFYTLPFQIISQCLIFPVLRNTLSETWWFQSLVIVLSNINKISTLTLYHLQLITWRNTVKLLFLMGKSVSFCMYWFVLFRHYGFMPLPLTQITYTSENISFWA